MNVIVLVLFSVFLLETTKCGNGITVNISEDLDNLLETTAPTAAIATLDPLCTPGKIQNLNITSGAFNATISWDAPENGCVEEYEIRVNDDLFANWTSTNGIITDLIACETYTVSVIAVASDVKGETETGVFVTNVPEPFTEYRIQNLDVTQIDLTLNVTWESPGLNVEKCIADYYVLYWDQDDITKSKNVTTLFCEITPIIGCMEYNFYIYPRVSASIQAEAQKLLYIAKGSVTNPPSLISRTPQKNSIEIRWATDSYNENMCDRQEIITRCEANENNTDSSWIVENGEDVFNMSDPERPIRFNVTVLNLSPFTNYTCKGIVVNSVGNSSESDEFEVRTNEQTTSPPLDLEVYNQTSESFVVTWNEPAIIPGIMEQFGIAVQNLGPIHYVQERCLNKTGLSATISSDLYLFTFEEGFPNFIYTVEVFGIDGAGRGESSKINVTTEQSNPNVPEQLIIQKALINNDTDANEYNVTQPVTWEAPCNTNGFLKEFIIHLEGQYTENQNREELDTDYRNFTVEKNLNETDIAYRYNFNDIQPSYNYTVSVQAVLENNLTGEAVSETFISPEGLPGPPILHINNTTENTFDATWEEPTQKYGKILSYNLVINSLGPLYPVPSDCDSENYTSAETNFPANELQYVFRDGKASHNYTSYIRAETSAGFGHKSNEEVITTMEFAPEPVRDHSLATNYSQEENYVANATISFKPPCNTYGPFLTYQIQYHGIRNNYDDHDGFKNSTETAILISLRPDYEYSLNVSVITNQFQTSTELEHFHSAPGVPDVATDLIPPEANETTKAYFTLSREAFNEMNGDISYYSLILLPKSDDFSGGTFGFWEGTEDTWPELPSASAQQLTTTLWNPFSDNTKQNSVSFVIGAEKDCEANTSSCNKQLKKNTEYSLIVRIFTTAAYKDSPAMYFKTKDVIPPGPALDLILGLLFGILLLIVLIIFIFILWRRKKKNLTEEKQTSIPSAIECKKFIAHYDYLNNNYNVVKSHFTTLGLMSKEIILTSDFAQRPENKRKNRYTNILPYDTTRVKLLIDEDDEISSDYINASYIKGFSGGVEYIATQGPLQSTSRDFWKMIIQENVSIIVMVTQFIEQSKEKCFQYFPNNHEKISFAEYEVMCAAELHFGTYCVRTLKIQKDSIQRTVIHMQFLDWPDFGVPSGTDNMLQFCCQLRERAKNEGGLVVVHCSAGVGRTGTIIASDMLLQTIDLHKDINVFKVVLELRKQRMNMVQTEKQYMFIHTCLKDALERPVTPTAVMEKVPIYENLNILRSSLEDNLIEPESESAL